MAGGISAFQVVPVGSAAPHAIQRAMRMGCVDISAQRSFGLSFADKNIESDRVRLKRTEDGKRNTTLSWCLAGVYLSQLHHHPHRTNQPYRKPRNLPSPAAELHPRACDEPRLSSRVGNVRCAQKMLEI